MIDITVKIQKKVAFLVALVVLSFAFVFCFDLLITKGDLIDTRWV